MKQSTIFNKYYTYVYQIPKNIPLKFSFFQLRKARVLGILSMLGVKKISLYQAICEEKKYSPAVDRLKLKKGSIFRRTFLNTDLVSMFSLLVLKPRVNSGVKGPNQLGKLTSEILSPVSKLHKLVIFRNHFLLIMSLFISSSVSAQSSVKIVDKENISPLMVGASVPDDFWTKKHLFYVNGDTVVRTLEQYKGKLLILDFWATWCGQCWTQMPKNEGLVNTFNGNMVMLLIDTKATNDTFEKIVKTDHKYLKGMGINKLETIFNDEYFASLFPVRGYPKYMWISPTGYFIAATTRNSVTKGHISELLDIYKVK